MGRVLSFDELDAVVADARAAGQEITLTNGAFDLFHVGHLRYLKGAMAYGQRLLVAVNSDSSVRRAKGEKRPVVPESERAELVAAIEGVHWVVIFSDDTVEGIIRRVRPRFHAKGTDYTAESVPEAEVVRECGGEVVITGDPKDHSTTELVQALEPS